MSSIIVSHPTKNILAQVSVPTSKSITNRMLILQKVLGNTIKLENISEADDSLIMQQALMQTQGTVYIKNAGTCMRFLTAYYASTPGCTVVLDGSERMRKRPISALVDALRLIGAQIEYTHETGFPPLKITGKQLTGGSLAIDSTVSSQFASALALVAPTFKMGTQIKNQHQAVSKSYLDLTVALLNICGVPATFNSDIEIEPVVKNSLQPITYTIESDWSSAAFWYSLVALSKGGKITIPNLTAYSLQGDAALITYMHQFGVTSTFTKDGVILSQTHAPHNNLSFDMLNQPDLVPAMAVTACALNVACTFTQVAHLQSKESMRLTALCNELSKCGFQIHHTQNELIIQPITAPHQLTSATLNTYDDHRLAMAFAQLALIFNSIEINDYAVVEKSYPTFWENLAHLGFETKMQ
jgi:3-phosphoshikimate 1-carboxyvinyltransferase